MAKAVTLKNNNNEEVYPVTDISLVNGELNGARIVNASVGPDKLTPNAVWNENIKDGAVTSNKIDWTSLRPTKSTTTSGGSTTAYWVKRVYPNGIIVYSGYATASWWTGANAWYADLTIRLPDSLTFDTARMMASISVQPSDAAVQGWGSVHEGANSWTICRNNRDGADITTTFYINLILVVFPA